MRYQKNFKPIFLNFFSGLERVAYAAHLWFLRDVWIRTQSASVASGRANDSATHPQAPSLNFVRVKHSQVRDKAVAKLLAGPDSNLGPAPLRYSSRSHSEEDNRRDHNNIWKISSLPEKQARDAWPVYGVREEARFAVSPGRLLRHGKGTPRIWGPWNLRTHGILQSVTEHRTRK